MSKVEVNEIRPQCGTTVTLGGAGETVALGACASATGFSSPCLAWCAAIKSTGFTAVAGKGYFVNTCGGGVTVTLPATATQGDTIEFKDYQRTWGTACKALTLNSNSLKYQGLASAAITYATDGQAVKIVYADATQGWKPTVDDDAEYKHQYNVQYLVVAGGGGGGSFYGSGGGGAGGYITSTPATKCFTVVTGTSYPITIGAAGAAGDYSQSPRGDFGGNGCNSVFSTITSAGGGGGGGGYALGALADGQDGGSGGGGGSYDNPGTGGSGNVPTLSPPQGNDGGDGPGATPANPMRGGGGGGACAVGTVGAVGSGGTGGDGIVNGIRGVPFDPVAYAGGG